MADEQTQVTPGIDDITEPEFNWGQFFAADEPTTPEPTSTPPVAAQDDESGDESDDAGEEATPALKAQIEELQKMVAETAKTTREIATTNKVTTAVEAWKQQASPAELAMADVLSEATSLEDLQTKAALVKRVAAGADKMLAGERIKIEQKMQKEFGLPVSPSFQPIPEKEKMDEALAGGDIVSASAQALKGLFNT